MPCRDGETVESSPGVRPRVLAPSGRDSDEVFDFADTRRRPCGALGLLLLRPGSDPSVEPYGCTCHFDVDPSRVQFSAASQGLFDVLLKIRCCYLRPNITLVDYSYYAFQLFNCRLGEGLLILPVHCAFKCNPS